MGVVALCGTPALNRANIILLNKVFFLFLQLVRTKHEILELLSIFRSSIRVWHPLNTVTMLSQVHDRNTRDLPDPSLQVLVTSRHDVGLVLSDPVDQTVVGVCALEKEVTLILV